MEDWPWAEEAGGEITQAYASDLEINQVGPEDFGVTEEGWKKYCLPVWWREIRSKNAAGWQCRESTNMATGWDVDWEKLFEAHPEVDSENAEDE